MAELPVRASTLEVLSADYDILGEVGGGGASVVYRARDRQLGRDVAVKVIRDHRADDAVAVARFEREARLLAPLHHPNILSNYGGIRLEGGALALVMQPPRGRTLREVIDEEGALPAAQTMRILRDVASALRYLHGHGVVHRNLNPENILLDAEGGRALVSDFGISKPLDELSGITLPGVVLGTPAYMAPEQISGAALDPRCDLYSLGVIGYEMLLGRHPWAEASLYGMVFRHQTQSLPPVAELCPGTPLPLRLALEKAVAKDPAQRWRSADEMLQQLLGTGKEGSGAALHPVLDEGPVSKRAEAATAGAAVSPALILPPRDAAEPEQPDQSANRRWVPAAAALVVLLGAVLVGSYLRTGGGAGAVSVGRGDTEGSINTDALPAEQAATGEAAPGDAAAGAAAVPGGGERADDPDVQELLRRLQELEGQVERSRAGSGRNAPAAAPEGEDLPSRRVDPGAIPGALPALRPVLPIRVATPPSEPVSAPQLRNGAELRELIVERYPRHLRREGIGDTITVSLLVDASGRATAPEVTGPSAHPALNAAALEVAARMLFDPARQQGRPVPVRITVPIVFRWQSGG